MHLRGPGPWSREVDDRAAEERGEGRKTQSYVDYGATLHADTILPGAGIRTLDWDCGLG